MVAIQNHNEDHANRSQNKFHNLEKNSLKYSASKPHRLFNIICHIYTIITNIYNIAAYTDI